MNSIPHVEKRTQPENPRKCGAEEDIAPKWEEVTGDWGTFITRCSIIYIPHQTLFGLFNKEELDGRCFRLRIYPRLLVQTYMFLYSVTFTFAQTYGHTVISRDKNISMYSDISWLRTASIDVETLAQIEKNFHIIYSLIGNYGNERQKATQKDEVTKGSIIRTIN